MFAHQRLQVYRKPVTSMVLNIAEGIGRRGAEDRRRLLNMAEASAVKAVTCLDLCQRQDELDRAEAEAVLNDWSRQPAC